MKNIFRVFLLLLLAAVVALPSNAAFARYTQADPMGLRAGINPYSYVAQNPVNRVDPTGLDEIPPGMYNTYTNSAPPLTSGQAAVVLTLSVFPVIATLPESIFSAMGAGGEAGTGAQCTTALYRAVSPQELESLNANGGAFMPSPFGLEAKYFSTTPEGAASYANQLFNAGGRAYEGPYTIVQSSFPSSLPTDTFVDRGIPTVVVPNETLPQLSPAQPLNYTPIPPRLP